MPAIQTIECRSGIEFLAHIRRSNSKWWEPNSSASPWVFRGIGDANHWKLLPSAWRKEANGLRSLIHQIAQMAFPIKIDSEYSADEPCPNLRRYYEWVSAEREALYQFACAANELGFEIDSGSYQRNRSPLTLKSIGPVISSEYSPNIAYIAQHHGIPTRLLDWSCNPMVAAFFAVTPLCRPSESKKICVWALNTSHLTFQGPDEKIFEKFQVLVIRPSRSTNKFLHSQSGLLTEIAGISELEKYFIKNESWPPLEEVISLAESDNPILIAYTLDSKHADHLLMLLDREGVNHASLMPTLDNVAKTVRERWQRVT